MKKRINKKQVDSVFTYIKNVNKVIILRVASREKS